MGKLAIKPRQTWKFAIGAVLAGILAVAAVVTLQVMVFKTSPEPVIESDAETRDRRIGELKAKALPDWDDRNELDRLEQERDRLKRGKEAFDRIMRK